ncbi:hypothetical protein KR222_002404, partial [Zaprionus bogoriensis]
SNVVEQFIHPCERSIFIEILSILNYVNEIARFAKHYENLKSNEDEDAVDASEFSSGYYLKHFAKGIDTALEDYYNAIARLEYFHEKTTANSLIYIYNALELQLPTIQFLRKLINEARIQKLHGCGLLQNLHHQYGDVRMDPIISKVSKPVKLAFFFHLTHWLLFGSIDDPHCEFFISFKKSVENSSKNIDKSITSSNTNLSVMSDEDDIWQYEIELSQLPNFVSTVLAEKILFIGQTVLIFKLDRSRREMDQRTNNVFCDDVSELWDGKEASFCKMIEDLNTDDKIDVFQMEAVVNEMKKYVSGRLSVISVIEDDMNKQMKLVKDFYLLGRGEFYLEFLRQLYGDFDDLALDPTEKNYTRAFEYAANVMGIANELESFSLSVLKTDFEESCEFGMLQNLHLKYIYKWPLNLLFSPLTIERYNHVFRFLLTIRKLQYDLQLVWIRHKWNARTANPVHSNILTFRNHLTFFLDNLQYYIQVDVLESQFCILMNVIKSKVDFEEIQRAHTVFLANVLSQCFLLADGNDKKINVTQTTCRAQYSIYGTILEIFNLCEKFCLFDSAQSEDMEELEVFEERFNTSILELMQLLGNITNASSFGPLSQFLLRLDYNRWFSTKRLSLE